MKQPQEIEVWYILPAIRKELAKLMFKEMLTQKEIAKKLDITEAAVSYYIKEKRGKNIRFNKRINSELKKAVKRILNKSNPVKEIQNICNLAKKDLILCKIHKKHGAPKTCKVCLK